LPVTSFQFPENPLRDLWRLRLRRRFARNGWLFAACFQFPDDTRKIRKFLQFHSLIFCNLRLFVPGVAAAARLAEGHFAANQPLAFSGQPLAVSFCEWSKSIAAIQNWVAAAIFAE